MPDFDEPETDTYSILDVGGRGVLYDTRKGSAWILCGIEQDKPYWKPIRWSDKSELKEKA